MPEPVPDGGVFIAFDVIRMLLQEHGGGAAVVIDQIQKGFHAEIMGAADKILEVLIRSILRIDMEIVFETVGVFRIFDPGFFLTLAPVVLVHIVKGIF